MFDVTLAAIPIEEWDEFEALMDGKLNPGLFTLWSESGCLDLDA